MIADLIEDLRNRPLLEYFVRIGHGRANHVHVLAKNIVIGRREIPLFALKRGLPVRFERCAEAALVIEVEVQGACHLTFELAASTAAQPFAERWRAGV